MTSAVLVVFAAAVWVPVVLAVLRVVVWFVPELARDLAAEAGLRRRERMQRRWVADGKPGLNGPRRGE